MAEPLDPRWGKPGMMHDPYALAHFRARPTDVLIVTAPKAGTTWMQQILYQMKTGGDPTFESIFDVVPWLEAPTTGVSWQQRLASFEELSEPRVFKTHCTVPQTPGLDVARIVLTFRDPRECCVSFFHHVNGMEDGVSGMKPFESMQQCVDRFIEFGAWYRNVAGWWGERERPNLAMFRYTDLKSDLGAAVDRLSALLGWSLAPDARRRVLEYSSFPWMKANAEKFTRMTAGAAPSFKKGEFIRKGEAGGASRDLTDEQSAAILARARETVDPECLAWLGIDRV